MKKLSVPRTRKLHFACPLCFHVETRELTVSDQCRVPPPDEETIQCTCSECFSKRLDRVYPGARPRYERRMRREAQQERARLEGPK